MTKSPFTGVGERAADLLGLIHSDVCGPMSTTARGSFGYFVTFTDDLSRYGYVYLMRQKSETFDKFKEFQKEVENQLGKTIKALRSDRGGEYMSQVFDDHLKDCGILSQFTPPGTPQWNGVSERRNRTLLDMVRSMMSLADLPISFWGHALETAAFTLNRELSKAVEKTPYEIWTGRVPILSFLNIWGCEAYVRRLQPEKLGPKSDKCLFVGYPKETKGYFFYNRSDNKVYVARDGVILEKEFLSKEPSGRKIHLEEIREEQPQEEQQMEVETSPPLFGTSVPQEERVEVSQPIVETPNTSETLVSTEVEEGSPQGTLEVPAIVAPAPRRSQRHRTQPDRYLGIMMTENYEITLWESGEPYTYNEALEAPTPINGLRP